jgi:subtilisin family serine protease
MKFSITFTVLLGLFLSAMSVLSAQNNTDRLVIPGQYYVEFNPSQRIQKGVVGAVTVLQESLGSLLLEEPKPLVSDEQIAQFYAKKSAVFTNSDQLLTRSRHFYKVKLREDIQTLKELNKLRQNPAIKSIEPIYYAKLSFEPNDPALTTNNNLKYALETTMKFFDAWDIQRADSSIVIAILDSGVDYTHPDLVDKLWFNIAELTGEAGVDDDNNGFIDDTKGWDFWQAGDVFNPIQDNDPMIDVEDHGTHVAGTAAATPNNAIGLVGTGYNAKIMAVKMGGIASNPTAISSIPEGMLYAGLNGANVLNCSFGGGGSNDAVQAIVNDLTDMGVIIVAASGNDRRAFMGYPAAYDNVLSVGSSNIFDGMSSFSNYDFNLDVVAVGSGVYSTTFSPSYTTKSGTSMSTPMVAGLAALVRAQHPNWSAQQVMAQIRSSARDIYGKNGSQYANRLGGGMIDAQKALGPALPGVRVHSFAFQNTDGTKLSLTKEGRLTMKVVNDGALANNLSITINQPENYWDLSSVQPQSGLSLATRDTLELIFSITLRDNFSFQTVIPQLVVSVEDASFFYDDTYVLEYNNLLFDIHQENDLIVSYGANGTIGFLEPFTESGGRGFIPRLQVGQDYEEFDNQLFEGGMMITAGSTVISSVRGSLQPLRRDFTPIELIQFEKTTTSSGNILTEGRAKFKVKDQLALPLEVDLRTLTSSDPELAKAVFFEYTLTNKSDSIQRDIRLGLFKDWDLPDYKDNSIDWSAADSLQIIKTLGENKPFIAVAHIGNVASAFAINNDFQGTPDSLRFNIYDGYTDQEKIWSLSSGTLNPEIDIAKGDVSVVSASGPWTLYPDQAIKTAFVLTWGRTKEEIRQTVANSRAANLVSATKPGTYTNLSEFADSELPSSLALNNAYPNPFNPTTTLSFDLNKTSEGVILEIFDIQGKRMSTLVNGRLSAGSYQYTLNAMNWPSGVYLVRLQANGQSLLQKISLLK